MKTVQLILSILAGGQLPTTAAQIIVTITQVLTLERVTVSGCGTGTLFELESGPAASTLASLSPSSLWTPSSATALPSQIAQLPLPVPWVPDSYGHFYRLQGCFPQDWSATTPLERPDYKMLTLELCGAACAGRRYFGVQAGSLCLCSNQGSFYSAVNESSCNTPCSGDASEACGSTDYIQIYKLSNAMTGSVANPASTVTASATTSFQNATVSGPSSFTVSQSTSTSPLVQTTSSATITVPSLKNGTSSSVAPLASSTTWAKPTCNSIFTDKEGGLSRIYCNADWTGATFETMQLGDFAACIEACESTRSNCLAAVWSNQTQLMTGFGSCDLKQQSANANRKRDGMLVYKTGGYVAYMMSDKDSPTPDAPVSSAGSGFATLPGTTSASTGTTLQLFVTSTASNGNASTAPGVKCTKSLISISTWTALLSTVSTASSSQASTSFTYPSSSAVASSRPASSTNRSLSAAASSYASSSPGVGTSTSQSPSTASTIVLSSSMDTRSAVSQASSSTSSSTVTASTATPGSSTGVTLDRSSPVITKTSSTAAPASPATSTASSASSSTYISPAGTTWTPVSTSTSAGFGSSSTLMTASITWLTGQSSFTSPSSSIVPPSGSVGPSSNPLFSSTLLSTGRFSQPIFQPSSSGPTTEQPKAMSSTAPPSGTASAGAINTVTSISTSSMTSPNGQTMSPASSAFSAATTLVATSSRVSPAPSSTGASRASGYSTLTSSTNASNISTLATSVFPSTAGTVPPSVAATSSSVVSSVPATSSLFGTTTTTSLVTPGSASVTLAASSSTPSLYSGAPTPIQSSTTSSTTAPSLTIPPVTTGASDTSVPPLFSDVSTSTTSAPTATSTSNGADSATSDTSASATSSPTGVVSLTPRLSNPTLLGSNDEEQEYSFQLPFTLQLYTQSDTNMTVTTNGVFSIGDGSVVIEAYSDGGSTPPSLPTYTLVPGTAAVWWHYMWADTTPGLGVYWQLDGGGTFLSVEWLLYDSNNAVTNFILTYDQAKPGNVTYYYFSDGDTGAASTVGVQGLDTSNEWESVTFESDVPNSIKSGMAINFATNPDVTSTGTSRNTTFDVDCFPPGSFPAGVCGTPAT